MTNRHFLLKTKLKTSLSPEREPAEVADGGLDPRAPRLEGLRRQLLLGHPPHPDGGEHPPQEDGDHDEDKPWCKYQL